MYQHQQLKLSYIIVLCLSVSLFSLLFFALQNEWLIVQWPTHKHHSIDKKKIIKKECSFFYWQHAKLHKETMQLIWSTDHQANIHYIINTWLTLLYDEELLHKRVQAETCCICSSGQELFISFDRNPFTKQQAMHEKICFIESLLRTIHSSSQIQHVRFLVHHKPMQDPHLDFTQSWPIQGYLI